MFVHSVTTIGYVILMSDALLFDWRRWFEGQFFPLLIVFDIPFAEDI